jgi:hypothetical protein
MMRRGWHQQFKQTPAPDRTYQGILFHSKGEMQRYMVLLGWQKQGLLTDLKRQVRYKLILPDGTPITYPPTVDKNRVARKGILATYTVDFEYDKILPNDAAPLHGAVKRERVIEEYKGFDDGTGKLRRAVFEAIYKIKIRVVKKPLEAL